MHATSNKDSNNHNKETAIFENLPPYLGNI